MTQTILVVGSGFAGLWGALAAARVVQGQRERWPGVDGGAGTTAAMRPAMAADAAAGAARDAAGNSVGGQEGNRERNQEAGTAGDEVAVLLVAPHPRLAMRPRLHESDPAAWTLDILPHLRAAGVRYVQGEVRRIHGADGYVDVAGPDGAVQALGYDRLVLAAGSALRRPDLPGIEHVHSIDQPADAARLDAHLRALAALPDTPARQTVVVVGAGFTGIELACELPARLRTVLPGAQPRIVLVEQAGVVGPELGAGPRPVIEQALDSLGIERRLGLRVSAVDGTGVRLDDGTHVAAATVIWTGGMRASPLAAQVAAPGTQALSDALGRVPVGPDLRVAGAPRIFAAGDAAVAATDDAGHSTLMACQHALVTGRYAGHNAACDLLGLPTMAYRQPTYVTCLDLGGWGAVFTQGWERNVAMAGADAKALKIRVNTEWIYPPAPERAALLAAAHPDQAFAG